MERQLQKEYDNSLSFVQADNDLEEDETRKEMIEFMNKSRGIQDYPVENFFSVESRLEMNPLQDKLIFPYQKSYYDPTVNRKYSTLEKINDYGIDFSKNRSNYPIIKNANTAYMKEINKLQPSGSGSLEPEEPSFLEKTFDKNHQGYKSKPVSNEKIRSKAYQYMLEFYKLTPQDFIGDKGEEVKKKFDLSFEKWFQNNYDKALKLFG